MSRAPDPLADACARYAGLILQQIEALGVEDVATFDECSAARDALEEEIEALVPAAAGAAASAVRDGAAEQFARCHELDRLLMERLAELRAEAAAALAEHDERRHRVLAYGSAPPPAPAAAVDVRL